MNQNIKVTKRNGQQELIDMEKIHRVVHWASQDLKGVSVSQVEINAQLAFFDGIKTEDIHETIIKSAADLISTEVPDYQYLAARLAIFHLRKKAFKSFTPPALFDHIKKFTDLGIYDQDILNKYTQTEIQELDEYIDHWRDMKFSYAAVKQLEGKYLVQNRVTGDIYESPQQLYMLVGMCLFQEYEANARMIMFGLKFAGDVPFKDIYITGLIRDGQGQKMSKSKGNVLDPIDLIDGISLEDLLEKRTQGMMQPKMAKKIKKQTQQEFADGIPAFGTDALRFTFAALASFGRDIKFDLKRVEGYRNFCNKLWNASRFVLMKLEGETIDTTAPLSTADKWILSRLQVTKKNVEKHLKDYRLDLMSQELYEFVWHDYCDWYLELSKPLLQDDATKAGTQATLIKVLNEIVSLLHPIIPFITEEIFEQCNAITGDNEISLMTQSYPEVDQSLSAKDSETEIKWLQTFILGIRKIRGEMNIPPSKPLPCFVQNFNQTDALYLQNNANILNTLAKMESIDKLNTSEEAPESATALVGEMKILIPLAGLIDKDQEISRLNKEIEKLEKQKMQFEGKLNNDKFVSGAPEAIVNVERERLSATLNAIGDLNDQLNKISNL